MLNVFQKLICVAFFSVDNVNNEYAIRFNDMKCGMVNIVVLSKDNRVSVYWGMFILQLNIPTQSLKLWMTLRGETKAIWYVFYMYVFFI